MKSKEIKKLALSALICALSAAVCIAGSIFSTADLTCCAIASGMMYIALIELSGKYPLLIFAVSGALMLILFPSSSATVFYLAFFGYYPIIKGYLEKLPRILIYIAKLALFNGIIILLFRFASHLFIAPGEPADSPLLIAALLLANVFFFVYDTALTFGGMAYRNHYRRVWGIDRLMR